MRIFFLSFMLLVSLYPKEGMAQGLTVSVGQATASAGSTVCVPVHIIGMRRMLSMQYSVKWDSKVLELVDIKNFRLPGMTKENFGMNQAAQGILTTLWLDNSIKGVDLPNGTPMYQLCFRVKGKAGTSSVVQILQKPTPFEAINKFEQFVQMSGVSGKVTVR